MVVLKRVTIMACGAFHFMRWLFLMNKKYFNLYQAWFSSQTNTQIHKYTNTLSK